MDRLRSIVVLVLALGQIVVPAVLFSRGFQVDVPGSPTEPTPIVPATYAFGIWWLIFAGALAQAVLGVLPRYLEHPVLRRIGWLTALLYAASIAWIIVARFGPNWLTLPIIVVMLAAAGTAYAWASSTLLRASWLLRGLVVVPLALYAGWLTVATFANLSELLAAYDVAWFTRNLLPWTIVLLGVATVVAIEGIILGAGGVGSLVYAGTVVWALVAIVVANAGSPVAFVAVGGIVTVLLALALRYRGVAPPV